MPLGAVRLKRRRGKIQRMIYAHDSRTRTVSVKVYVDRYHAGTTVGYVAHACLVKYPSRHAGTSRLMERIHQACGPEAVGHSPTAAIGRALVEFGKRTRSRG